MIEQADIKSTDLPIFEQAWHWLVVDAGEVFGHDEDEQLAVCKTWREFQELSQNARIPQLETRSKFEDWLAEDSRHRDTYRAIERSWGAVIDELTQYFVYLHRFSDIDLAGRWTSTALRLRRAGLPERLIPLMRQYLHSVLYRRLMEIRNRSRPALKKREFRTIDALLNQLLAMKGVNIGGDSV